MNKCINGHNPDIFAQKIGGCEQTKCVNCGRRIFRYAASTRWMTDYEYRVYITKEIKDGLDNEV